MSRNLRRIAKLESLAPKTQTLPLILYQIHSVDGAIEPGPAKSPGVGQIDPMRGESEQDFLRRAYAMHAAQMHPSDMTEEEFEAALLAGDEMRAKDSDRTGIEP